MLSTCNQFRVADDSSDARLEFDLLFGHVLEVMRNEYRELQVEIRGASSEQLTNRIQFALDAIVGEAHAGSNLGSANIEQGQEEIVFVFAVTGHEKERVIDECICGLFRLGISPRSGQRRAGIEEGAADTLMDMRKNIGSIGHAPILSGQAVPELNKRDMMSTMGDYKTKSLD